MTDELTTASIAGIAAIAGGLLSGVYQHARDYFNRPKLDISYRGSSGNKTTARFKIQDKDIEEVFIRIRIENIGKSPAKNCRMFLTSVKELVNSKEIDTIYFDSKPLSWPGWDFEPRDIPVGVVFYADLIGVYKHVEGWNFKVKELSASEASMKNYSGTLRFGVIATSENAQPTSCKVDVTYQKDWKQLRATAV